ncbi:MAG: extracellular solute-binding protein [Chloroflexota bacterium]
MVQGNGAGLHWRHPVERALLGMSRRGFMRVAAGSVFAMSVALLDACKAAPSASSGSAPATATAGATPTSASASAPAAVKPTAAARVSELPLQLPIRVPIEGVKADLPASADGLIDAGFINYPGSPFKSVADTPGRGGDVSVATWTTSALPTPMDSNALWQAVNKELGVNLKINIQPQADYPTVTLPTMIAGGELPDIVYIATNSIIPGFPDFLRSKMADLTPYLSGDAVKDYPNLANFPKIAWKSVVFNNAIYGVPVPYPLYLWVHWVHQNLLDQDGLAWPKNAADYKQLARHFTRPDQNLYGLGSENNVGMGITNGWITGIFGAHNNWALDEKTGTLTHSVETDQYRAAVSFARELWLAGLYHPNAMQYNLVSARNDFAARRFAFRFDGFQSASVTFWDNAPTLNPPGKPRIISPFPAQDGGKPTFWAGAGQNSGSLGFSAIRQAAPQRIKEMLRILNYLAAPMGSQEYLLMNYGQKDVHWTPDEKGNPIANARGKADALVPWRYITQGPVGLYYPKDAEYAGILQDAEKGIFPYVSINATDGYYSNANASKRPTLDRMLYEQINDIVIGRQPEGYFTEVIKTWRDLGGEQIRTEFQQAIAAAKA